MSEIIVVCSWCRNEIKKQANNQITQRPLAAEIIKSNESQDENQLKIENKNEIKISHGICNACLETQLASIRGKSGESVSKIVSN